LNPDIAYNPPERVLYKKLKFKFHKNSYATDLWAFGVLFLELITNGALKESLYGYYYNRLPNTHTQIQNIVGD
jgi:serine/threonine protein kinase